jgi:flagellar hook protein FlgE
MIGSMHTSTNAILAFSNQMSGVADRVSKAFQPGSKVDVGKEFATSDVIKRGIEANAKVIHVEDEMVGSVLDIIA